jgi:hypothetical protein
VRLLDGVTAGALLSPGGAYRYILTREWDSSAAKVTWIMLNPSTADASEDDRTIRKCQVFARRWGYGGIAVVNLFAYRATKPADLLDAAGAGVDPIGAFNDEWIGSATTDPHCKLVVAAWGAYGAFCNRGLVVLERLMEAGVRPMRLGLPTKGGHPRHPLYLAGNTSLEEAV